MDDTAVLLYRRPFDGVHRFRHHQVRFFTRQPAGQRNALGMIPGRQGHHGLGGRSLHHGIVRPAKLERAHALKVFALQKHGGVRPGVELPGSPDRRFTGDALQASRRAFHVMKIGKSHNRPV